MATNTTPAKAAPAPAKPEAKKTQKIAPVPAPATDAAKKKTQRIEAVKPATPAPAPSKAKTQKIEAVKADPAKKTQKIAPVAPAPYKPTAHKGFVDEGEIFRAINKWNVANGIPIVPETGTDGLPNWTWEFDPKTIPGGLAFSVVETDPKSYAQGDWKAFALAKGLPVILGCKTCRRTFGGVMCD